MGDSSAVIAGLGGYVLVAYLVAIAYYVWMSLALAKVFRKLGESGWKAWVPLVNSITIFELGGHSAIWVIALLFPVVNIVALVVMIMAMHTINKRFGKGGGHTFLAIFFPPIWASLLGFGKALPVWTPPGIAGPAFVNVVVNNGGYGPVSPGFDSHTSPGFSSHTSPGFSSHTSPGFSSHTSPGFSSLTSPGGAFGGRAGTLTMEPPVDFGPPVVLAPPAPPTAAQAEAPELPAPAFAQQAPSFFGEAAPVVEASVPSFADPAPVFEWSAPATASDPVAEWSAPAGPGLSAPAEPVEAPVAQPVAEPWVPPIDSVPGLPAFHEEIPEIDSADAAPALVPPVLAAPAAEASEASVEEVADVAEVEAAETESDDAAEELVEATVVAPRRRKTETWFVETEAGQRVALTGAVALLGRNPSATGTDAQLVAISDSGMTVSKTHARVELADGGWTITDLGSTNGVYLLEGDEERELEVGVTTPITERFLLGELSVRVFSEA